MTTEKTPRPPAQPAEADGPLARWAARKAKIQTQHAQTAPTPIEPTPPEQPASTHRPPTTHTGARNDQLAEVDLPDLDSLDEHSDVSGFFSPKVSAELRRLALRKLFHLPHLNVTDGLDDYAEDYTKFAPLGDIVTADMRHAEALKRLRGAQAERTTGGNDEPEPQAAVTSGQAPEAGPDTHLADSDTDRATDLNDESAPGSNA